MTWAEIFIHDDCLRPIWRFFLCVLLILCAFVVTGAVLGAALHARNTRPKLFVILFWESLLFFMLMMGAYKLMLSSFDRRPLGSAGFAFYPRWWKELLHGVGVGAAMLFLTVIAGWSGGLVHFTLVLHPMRWAGAFSFAVFALAAANEEAIFRGYPFQRLVESITPAGAIAATSVFFGLVHLGNPHETWLSTCNTILVGIILAIAYLRTRALWLPLGIHISWNFLMGFVLGLPVSGLLVPSSVLTAGVHGPVWLTGGAYGPEGDILTTAACLIAMVYVAFAKSIYTTEEMKALVFAAPRSPEPTITIFPPEESN